MTFKFLRNWHMPRSLLGRMLLLTLLAILLAQTLSSAIWLFMRQIGRAHV